MSKTFKRIILGLWTLFVVGILSVYLIFSGISRGWIGNTPSIDDLENPIDKFATQIISADGVLLGTFNNSSDNRVWVDFEELSRRLTVLHNLTFNSRMARANRVQVTVTYYEPCSDENSEAYGLRGQYKTITGICWNVDAEVNQTILVDRKKLSLSDVLRIESADNLFQRFRDDP